ncbi:unnamed protein product [Calypogeia fissa]
MAHRRVIGLGQSGIGLAHHETVWSPSRLWQLFTGLREHSFSPQFARRSSSASSTELPPGQVVESAAKPESSGAVEIVPKWEEVVIALGGNIGDRVNNFNKALEMLREAGIRVTGYGCLYESAPAYVTDQPMFLNSAIKASTSLDPYALLRTVKKIERELGRSEAGLRYGPRPIDLDIIFHGSSTVNTDVLQIPHPRLIERPFVLAPVVDLLGGDTLGGPAGHWSAHPFLQRGLLEVWRENGGEECVGKEGLKRVTPIGSKLWDWGQKTYIMGILNLTPDSFSDGGLYTEVDSALAQVRRMVSEGADFIDIGAQSTRPGAQRLTTERELERLLPVLDALADAPDLKEVCFSIDTFDSRVVKEAVARGVHLVNDVSAGLLDPEMWETVSKLGVSYVAMHMRGDPTVMQNKSNTSYSNLCFEVATELASNVRYAELAGIPAWRIITDPGLGFAKSFEQNVELMRELRSFREQLSVMSSQAIGNGPILLGPSRKGFLGKLCGHPKGKDRDFATVAATVVGIAGGADIIRAHNVSAVQDAVKVADAVYKMKAGHPEKPMVPIQ